MLKKTMLLIFTTTMMMGMYPEKQKQLVLLECDKNAISNNKEVTLTITIKNMQDTYQYLDAWMFVNALSRLDKCC